MHRAAGVGSAAVVAVGAGVSPSSPWARVSPTCPTVPGERVQV